jgi:phosphoribosylanthranilate isomerase
VTRVKICGISESIHAQAAVEAGADLIGLVFAPSKRLVDVEQAKEIVTSIKGQKELNKRIEQEIITVGVFVNTPTAEVNRVADYCSLDRVQLSGDEPWDYVRAIERPIIKAVRVRRHQSSEDVLAELAPGEQLQGSDIIYLLDCHIAGSYGGSGQAFDWKVAQDASERFPVIIAGGLCAENVDKAIRIAGPWGVDVSSGIESDGTKDISKIKAFIAAVRHTDQVLRKQSHEKNPITG